MDGRLGACRVVVVVEKTQPSSPHTHLSLGASLKSAEALHLSTSVAMQEVGQGVENGSTIGCCHGNN